MTTVIEPVIEVKSPTVIDEMIFTDLDDEGVVVEHQSADSDLVQIIGGPNEIKTSVQFFQTGSESLKKRLTFADKYQSFISKIFGNQGKPFKDPALFFYLSGLFTVLMVLLFCCQVYCVFRIIRRR